MPLRPNLDKLASQGIYFTNAHCASPICGPSRASILTGLRPETSGCYTNLGTYVDYVPDAVSLPRYFLDHNYHVMGAGKINHALGMVVPENWHEYGPDCGIVWLSLYQWRTSYWRHGSYKGHRQLNCTLPMNWRTLPDWPSGDEVEFIWLGTPGCDDNEMPDGEIAQWAVNQLGRDHDSAFFLAVGFYKPHQPFFVPRKYFDLYDPMRFSSLRPWRPLPPHMNTQVAEERNVPGMQPGDIVPIYPLQSVLKITKFFVILLHWIFNCTVTVSNATLSSKSSMTTPGWTKASRGRRTLSIKVTNGVKVQSVHTFGQSLG